MMFKKLISIVFLTCCFISASQAFTITSEAFANGEELPNEYSCNGSDISPPLTISNAPEGTKSFVLIMEDPDAPNGTWLHWIAYNLPASTTTISENAPTNHTWDDGTMQGKNDWGDAKYGGACPPDGTHRYFFKLYALDKKLDLKKKASLRKVKKAMKGSVIAKTKLMATYG